MVNLLRGILTFAVLQNFLTAVLIWQVAKMRSERRKQDESV